jgi:NADH-quinone oxidoreductase subunit A
MLVNYLHIFLFIIIAFLFGIAFFCAAIFLSSFISNRSRSQAKRLPYECGSEAFSNARIPFNVRYYLIAVLFIIFDVEMAFLFPWAMIAKDIPWTGFIAMGIFLGILTLGLIYEWKKGALEWD